MLLSRCLLHFPDGWLVLEFLSEGLLLGESKLSQDPVATYWMMDKYVSWTSQCHCFALTAAIIPEMSWAQVANGVSADSETHLPSVLGTPGFVPGFSLCLYLTSLSGPVKMRRCFLLCLSAHPWPFCLVIPLVSRKKLPFITYFRGCLLSISYP